MFQALGSWRNGAWDCVGMAYKVIVIECPTEDWKSGRILLDGAFSVHGHDRNR